MVFEFLLVEFENCLWQWILNIFVLNKVVKSYTVAVKAKADSCGNQKFIDIFRQKEEKAQGIL